MSDTEVKEPEEQQEQDPEKLTNQAGKLPNYGGGFSLNLVDSKEEPEEEPEPEEQPSKKKDAKPEKVVWGPNPCISDQYLNFEDTVRPGSFHCKLYNLSDKEGMEDYNKLLSLTGSPGQHRVVITEKQNEFYEGEYYVRVEYARMEFKQFIDIKGPKGDPDE